MIWRLLAGTLFVGAAQIAAPPHDALVRVGVTLETTSGVPVLEIDCAKFEVRVDDQVRPIRDCARGTPVTAALLLDASGSFSYELGIREIVEALGERLRPIDRLGVGWFGGTMHPPAAFTRDRRALDAEAEAAAKAAAESVREAIGPSPLWDALAATVGRLAREPGRRAVIVLTDGRATGNEMRFAVAAREIVMSGAEMHVIGSPFIDVPPERANPERDLMNRPGTIALATGGTASPLGRSDLVKPKLRAILDGLQRSYQLSFVAEPPAKGGEIRRLDVRVNLRGIVVRAADRVGVRDSSLAGR